MSQNNYLDITNYVFQKDIGEGNFGKVKLGIFRPTGEEFAIKILNKNKIKIKMKNSIFKENEIITRFNHINVVYVFQILEDAQNFYIIMEYCKHGELFDYIVKKEKLSEEESSIFFYQLINGIEYIHSKGISHRDLKPENLLLAENKILKIIDFGLSHEFEGDELLKTKCGSPSYAAPEIICCPFYDGFKVDVWCCGIILYAMLCGYLPFEGEDNNLLFQNILNCDPEFPEFLSDLSKDIILQILNPDPETRITIEEIKKHKFYLKGKKLCKIDYDNIENNIIKKRNVFGKNKDSNNKRNNNMKEKGNKIMDTSHSDLTENDYNNNLENINDNNDKYMYEEKSDNNNIKIDDINESDLKDISESNENINIENINKESLRKSKNESPSLNNFKKQIMEINSKYNKRIDTINNKIQRILKTDANDNYKVSIRPFSSNKKIVINNNVTSVSNNSNFNAYNNSKPERQQPFFNIISETKENNNIKKNALFIKLLDSAKNKYFNIEQKNENNFDSIKSNSKRLNFNINTEIVQKKENKTKTEKPQSFFTNFKNNSPQINLNLLEDNKTAQQNHIISLSNDNLNDIEKQIQTCKNKKSQKFNLFKKSTKPEKNKAKNYFNIKKTLSRHDTNIESNKYKENKIINNNNNIARKTSNSKPKTKQLNLYVPNSTLYYNNININIKEVNINSKEPKNNKNNIISSFINNTQSKRIKMPSQPKRVNTYRQHYDNKNKNRIGNNKAFSAKRLFSYNINTKDIHNLKTNINSINHTRKNSNNNININKVNKVNKIHTDKNKHFNDNNSNNNLYTISNSNRHYFINTMYNNDINFNYNYNYNIINPRKTPKYGYYNNNIKFTQSEKNINILKGNKILSTEPKDIIKKQFSFNRKRKNNNINSKKIRLNSEMNSGINYSKDIKRRSKSNNIMKSRTINTEVRGDKKYKKGKIEGVNQDLVKKFGTRYNSNNIDEMLLYMFVKQKHFGKSNTQNFFRRKNEN